MNLESKTSGQRINELRKAKGLSQAQLAQEVSCRKFPIFERRNESIAAERYNK